MRNFLIADASTMKTSGSIAALTDLTAGQLAFVAATDGAVTALSQPTSGIKRYNLMFGYTDVENQRRHLVIPIYKNDFSVVSMTYAAATTFVATVTVNAPTMIGEHTIIVVKKGVPFNERAKFSSSVYVKDSTMTADDLATKLAAAINANSEASGVTASAATGVITITASKAGVDYEVLVADGLSDNLSVVAVTTSGIKAVADKEMIKLLASKAAADAGITDTYLEGAAVLYPQYPYPVDTVSAAGQYGYDIVTLRFAEPREMKTRDEVVHQIVQVAFPRTSTAANGQLAAFKTFVNALV